MQMYLICTQLHVKCAHAAKLRFMHFCILTLVHILQVKNLFICACVNCMRAFTSFGPFHVVHSAPLELFASSIIVLYICRSCLSLSPPQPSLHWLWYSCFSAVVRKPLNRTVVVSCYYWYLHVIGVISCGLFSCKANPFIIHSIGSCIEHRAVSVLWC